MQAAGGASLRPSDPVQGQRPERPPRRRALRVFAVAASVCYALDLASKTLALDRLSEGEQVPVLGELLQLTLVRNPGAAFSFATSSTLLLTSLAVVATAVVLTLARRITDPLWGFGLGCLLGGVLGNLTDRIFREPGFLRGHVIDFLQLPSWPVFNVADICINIGAGVIILPAVRGISLTGERSGREPEHT